MIKLHSSNTGRPMYVRSAMIAVVSHNDQAGGSSVWLSSDAMAYSIAETPEQILELMEKKSPVDNMVQLMSTEAEVNE